MNDADRIRLIHMRDAAQEAVRYAGELGTENALLEDRRTALAIVKLVEIIGEAASRISDATRKEIPEIPWPQIVGMRNRLIHVYFDINLKTVWKTTQLDLPPLIVTLVEALDAPGSEATQQEDDS